MFRINIYLSVLVFIKSIFFSYSLKKDKLSKDILKNSSKKKHVLFTSLCRVSFMLILMFLKKKFPKKNEIIMTAYNLPEMINVARNLKYKIVFCDIDYNTGFINLKDVKKKINKNTITILLTNMFNNYKAAEKIKKICSARKVFLIEDNAIYFDNFSKIDSKKINSGYLGDFTIYSFNIMKNISALYGGAVATNNREFYEYAKNKIKYFKSFPSFLILKQSIIFFILKMLSNKFLYKMFFFKIIKISHLNKINFFLKLFYPSLRFKKISFPKYYFSNMSNFSKNLVYYQLANVKIRRNNYERRRWKNIYYNKKLKKIRSKNFQVLKIDDINYQNFIDFPILTNNNIKLNEYLLRCGIETRLYYYNNCEKIFLQQSKNCKNSELFEKKLICLPNHNKITKKYIDFIVKKISLFYS